MNIDCLIPAAGFSSRMGDWKLILPYKSSTIIENSIANAMSVCTRVIIVTGYRGDELSMLVEKPPRVITVNNENYRKGMFSSIRAGVVQVKTEWFFITMGDMPAINKDIFYSLIETRDRSPVSYDIIRPMYHGKRGHPVLLHKKTIPVIIAEPDTSEMKNVFLNFRVMDIEMDAVNTFRDVDTPEEYRLISENNGL